MGEVLISAIQDLKATPVLSASNTLVQAGHQRFTSVHGPIRIEYNYFQQANGDDFASSDTFKTGLNRPRYAEVSVTRRATSINSATSGATVYSAESSATYKTVTIDSVDTQNHLGILVTVYGV
jgi:hypothetical protein